MKMIVCTSVAGLALLLSSAYLMAQQILPSKQNIDQQYIQQRSLGLQNPAQPDPNRTIPLSPPQAPVAGIIDDCQAPFSPRFGIIVNCWRGTINGVVTTVYAGVEGKELDPSQGILYIDDGSTKINSVPTPVKRGAVRIVSSQNNVLTLVSATGSYVLSFNATGLAFASVVVDNTPPSISGMPDAACTLWPPNHKLVSVATVTASDNTMLAPGSFTVTATTSEPISPTDSTYPDIVITPLSPTTYSVQLRADRLGSATDRLYTIGATARDIVGNVATATATCIVPHDHGR
jgi:hypothetical protein